MSAGQGQIFPTQRCIHWLHSIRMKDAGLRIRVQKELREQFLEACRAQDKPAAQVLREFMRSYVAQHNTEIRKPVASQERIVKRRPHGERG